MRQNLHFPCHELASPYQGGRFTATEQRSGSLLIATLGDGLPNTIDQGLAKRNWSALLSLCLCVPTPYSDLRLPVGKRKLPHRPRSHRYVYGSCRRTHHRSRRQPKVSE